MSSQIFKFPGFFEREIDLTATVQAPLGTPGGIIGTSEKGPAFVPVTVGSFSDYTTKFGTLNPRHLAPYAVDKYLTNGTALTFIRVLGAGSNLTTGHIDDTRTKGIVRNAGFKISGSLDEAVDKHVGSVQFIAAKHTVSSNEAFGMPLFSNNNTFFTTGSADEVFLVRGMLFAASDTRIQILSHNASWTQAAPDAATASPTNLDFKLVISSSAGASFSTGDGFSGLRILTASLDPDSDNYFAKILNTDPEKFGQEKHLVYCDFAVDSQLATISDDPDSVMIASGTLNTSTTSGDTLMPFIESFGRFDTRFKTPKTSNFISQPFGETEYDLFHVEALDDGAYSNTRFKISIANLQKSSNPKNDFGTFALQVRAFDDSDTAPKVLEQFSNVSLDPESENYLARVVGDAKVFYNFDSEDEDDRRLITRGRFPNRSRLIRVVMNPEVENGNVPATSLPFGFRGPEVLNTNPLLRDIELSDPLLRLAADDAPARLLGSVLPPVPFRFKTTRGDVSTTGAFVGAPGPTEIVDQRYYWGVKFERNNNVLNPNVSQRTNALIKSITKLNGLKELDVLVTGSYTDEFNNNKFTLAKVALSNSSLTDVTASAEVHMREAAYIRNGRPDGTEYLIPDPSSAAPRVTLASLYQRGTNASLFNRFSSYAKFTTMLQGGFDGTNILDRNSSQQNDRSTSTESRGSVFGNANGAFTSPGFTFNQNGVGLSNNHINSFRVASTIITDPINSRINLLAIPGQRDPLVTDFTSDKVRDFGLAFYIMDIPNYDSNGDRVFDGDVGIYVDVDNVETNFDTRALDNEFVGAYFPSITIDDRVNERRVTVPASVAALAAFSFTDKVAYPWFAPAGFNRAALDFVSLTQVKIKQPERERLFAARINPIVRFPRDGFVIMSQNTLEQAGSALQSINVVRMIQDVKKQVIDLSNRFIFDNISLELRNQLANSIRNVLTSVQSRQGIERFDVIADETNNTPDDVNNNRINCKIVLIPTRSIEFIAIDFIITRSGVEFV
jgi:hypothetical protein